MDKHVGCHAAESLAERGPSLENFRYIYIYIHWKSACASQQQIC